MVKKLITLGLAGLLALSGCNKKSPGQKLYGPNCGICHHGGYGLPGEIPPLIGRLDVIARTAQGRRFLSDVMLNGLSGSIVANGKKYNYSMPSFRQLSDQDLALILNWLISRGGTTPPPTLQPRDFAQARARANRMIDVRGERDALEALNDIP